MSIPEMFTWLNAQPKRLVDYVYDDVMAAVVIPRASKVLVQLSRPEELMPLIRVAAAARNAKSLPQDTNLAFCYDMLNKVSRR